MVNRRRSSFGAVELLPSGRFRVRYRAEGQMQRAPQTFDSRSDARKYLDTVRADLLRETWRAPRKVTETVGSYGMRWLHERTGIKVTTRALYESHLRLHIIPPLGEVRLDELRPDAVRTWYAGMRASLKEACARERRQSVASVRDGSAAAARAYRVLRAIYGTAVSDGLVATNPCQLRGAGTTKRGERPTLSVAEIQRLADEVPGRYSALVHLLAWSGARIGELAILRVGGLDLDPDAPSVLISQRVYLINGVYDVDTPKSAAGRRRIALPPHLVPILIEHVETYTTGQPDELVFTSSTGGSVLCTYSQMLSRALARIGRPDARVHDLRHTGMTLAAEAGASLADLKLRMGQSTTRAAELYIHATTDHGRSIANAMSALAISAGALAPRRGRTASAGQSMTVTSEVDRWRVAPQINVDLRELSAPKPGAATGSDLAEAKVR
jgi:integrase